MVKNTGHMFITGPDVIKTVLHEEVSKEELGGADAHAATSGVAHFAATDEAHALRMVRELTAYLPSNNAEDAPVVQSNDPAGRLCDELRDLIPTNANMPYDILSLIHI